MNNEYLEILQESIDQRRKILMSEHLTDACGGIEIEACTLPNMGKEANAGMVMDDSKTNTRLLNKNWSPLVVRKYQAMGWPLFISLICDADLGDLDTVVNEGIAKAKEAGFIANNIQAQRNFCGFLSDHIVAHYDLQKTGCTEGVAVIAYWDKSFISSCYGDLMTHTKCAIELYGILNMMTNI